MIVISYVSGVPPVRGRGDDQVGLAPADPCDPADVAVLDRMRVHRGAAGRGHPPDLDNLLPHLIRVLMYCSGVIFSIDRYVGDFSWGWIVAYQPVAVYLYLCRSSLLDEPAYPFDSTMWLLGGRVGGRLLRRRLPRVLAGGRRPMVATDPTDMDEIDFEIDPEDLDTAPVAKVDSDRLSLLVNDVHVTYRVFGAKKVGHGPAKKQSPIRRLLARGAREPAVREVKAVRGITFAAKHGESIGIIGVNGSGEVHPPARDRGTDPAGVRHDPCGQQPCAAGRERGAHEGPHGRAQHHDRRAGPRAHAERDGGPLPGDRGLRGDRRVREPADALLLLGGDGGARLRFAISSAAVPDILMVDEALATGDAAFRAKSKARMDEIRKSAGTVFLVSHSIATIQSMCTRVLWIHEGGRLVMDGPAEEVCPRYKRFVADSKKRAKAEAAARS